MRTMSSLMLCFILLLCGCTPIKTVQQYAASTQTTIENVRPVAKDFYDSCLRANRFKPQHAISECKDVHDASKAILRIANVLDEYAAALGALASDDLANYNTEIDALTKEIKELNVKDMTADKVDAIGALSKLVAKAGTSAYQQRQLSKFIMESNDAVVNVSNILANIIENNYDFVIEQELTAYQGAYADLEPSKKIHPLEWEAYSITYSKNVRELRAKQNAAKDLSKSIRLIGATHAKLKKYAEKLKNYEVAMFVYNFIKEAKPVVEDIKAAFSNK